MANRFKVKGINDDRDTCECCGKTGLKRVVWIEDTETLEVRAFGTTCAANPKKAFGLGREIKTAIRDYEKAQEKARRDHRNQVLTDACREATRTYTGEMRQGKFGPVPVDSDQYEAHKKTYLEAALESLKKS